MRTLNGRFATPQKTVSEKLLPVKIMILSIAFTWGVSVSPGVYQVMAEGANNATLDETNTTPSVTPTLTPTPTPIWVPATTKTNDDLIDFYAGKYTNSPSAKAHRKALLHCLYWKESRGGVDAHAKGDNGLASGPFQFHAPTYMSMRSKMIKQGVATEMGSRDDFESALDTTSWAISQGEGKQWGPILRGECK